MNSWCCMVLTACQPFVCKCSTHYDWHVDVVFVRRRECMRYRPPTVVHTIGVVWKRERIPLLFGRIKRQIICGLCALTLTERQNGNVHAGSHTTKYDFIHIIFISCARFALRSDVSLMSSLFHVHFLSPQKFDFFKKKYVEWWNGEFYGLKIKVNAMLCSLVTDSKPHSMSPGVCPPKLLLGLTFIKVLFSDSR